MPRALLATLVGLLVCASAGPAWSHGDIKRSAPGDGAGLSEPPPEVWIEFTEPPTQQARLEVTDPCGAPVGTAPPVVAGPRVTLPISATAKGEYSVRYAIVSRVDGHPSKGVLRFAVARGDKCTDTETSPGPGAAGGSQEASTSTVLFALGLAAAIGAGGGFVLRAFTR